MQSQSLYVFLNTGIFSDTLRTTFSHRIMHDTSASPIGSLIAGLLKDRGLDKQMQSYSALALWAEIVGETAARSTRAVSCERGILVVEVQRAIWRTELQLRKHELLEKLNQRIGTQSVQDIMFR
jgi:predicted nucleic acid-binding Zn ribbon protein